MKGYLMLLLHRSNHFKNRNLYQLSLTGVFFNENVKLYKFDGVKLTLMPYNTCTYHIAAIRRYVYQL